jgi:hypothetical protein
VIDVTQHIEQALYNCLTTPAITYEGTTVPVKAGFSLAEGLSVHHIIIDNVTDRPADTLTNYITEVDVTLQVVSLPDGMTHKVVNSISDSIRTRLQPSFALNGLNPALLSEPGLRFMNLRVSSPQGYIEEWQNGRPIIRKILNISLQVNHS